jgi:Transcriptional Coactivator p15 (PC4)
MTLSEPIAKFWKSARDRRAHVRVELSEYEGHPLINVRVWETGSDGIDRPTKKGIALTVGKLPELHAAIGAALAKARELRLIDDDGGEA